MEEALVHFLYQDFLLVDVCMVVFILVGYRLHTILGWTLENRDLEKTQKEGT